LTESGEIIPNKVAYIDEECHKALKRSQLKTNDILFSIAGALGRIGIVRDEIVPANTNQALAIIRLKNDSGVLVNYLAKYFNSNLIADEIEKLRGGAAQQNLSLTQLNELEIPLPPLSEQQRIVVLLDEAFAAIAKAKANAEQNLKNAKELFESYLQGVFEKKGDGWEEKTLGEIADVEYGFTDKSTEEGDYRYIRITDIDKNGELILEDKKYIKHSKEAKGFLIHDNDLLMARTGATFAKVLLFNGDEPSVFASYLIRIKFKEKIENALYWHFTKTKNYWEQANSLQSGAAQPHFNGAAVKQVVFAYPKSVIEQKALIEKFETLSIETKKLEAIYQQKINDLEELKKGVLKKAFAGELNVGAPLVGAQNNNE
jgi:type I restriction enzyme S subunit